MAAFKDIASVYERNIQQALQDIRTIHGINDLDPKKKEEAEIKIKILEQEKKDIQQKIERHIAFLERSGKIVRRITSPALDLSIEKLENVIKKSETHRKEWQRIIDALAASINGPSADFDRATAQMRNNPLNGLLIEYFPEREEFIANLEHVYDSSGKYILADSEKQSLLEKINREKIGQ